MKYADQLKTKEWAIVRRIIICRDNNKCRLCNSSTNLVVHHKVYIKNRMAWEYEEVDLITLCDICHKSFHKIKTVEEQNEKSIQDAMQNGLELFFNAILKEALYATRTSTRLEETYSYPYLFEKKFLVEGKTVRKSLLLIEVLDQGRHDLSYYISCDDQLLIASYIKAKINAHRKYILDFEVVFAMYGRGMRVAVDDFFETN